MITLKKQFSEDYSALVDSIKKELPALEKYIEKKFKLKCKLTLEYDKNRSKVNIESNSLMREATSDIDKLLFNDIDLTFWGGDLNTEENTSYIWFNAHLMYEHIVGGYNGCEIPNGQIYYNVQEHIWEDAEEVRRRVRASKIGK
jgi:hypothetical protein